MENQTNSAIDKTITAEQAEEIFRSGNPDGDTVRIRSAYRDLSCKMSGTECYRRVLYPGATETSWPDADRLPGRGIRAAERHCVVHCEVPVGTIVQDFERDVYRGSKGRCKRSYGIVTRTSDGKGDIAWLTISKRLRSRPVDVVELPSGDTIEIEHQ